MRYSEGNLDRLQVVGEYHVKSGKVMQRERVQPNHAATVSQELASTAVRARQRGGPPRLRRRRAAVRPSFGLGTTG